MTEESMHILQEMLSLKREMNVDLLIELAPEPLPEPLLSPAIKIAREISDKSKRILVAEELATRALKIELADDRARSLIDLSSLVSDAKRASLFHEAFEAAKKIENPWERAITLRDIFQLWPDATVLNKAKESLDAAREIMSGAEDSERLRVLSTNLSEYASRLLSPNILAETERESLGGNPTTSPRPKADNTNSNRPRASEIAYKKPLEGPVLKSMKEQIYSASRSSRIEPANGKPTIQLISSRADIPQGAKARETRIVNTGFAPESKANKKLKGTTLQPDRSYYFWLDVGKLSHDTMETKPTPLPKDLPIGARLVVALFPFKDEIRIKPGSDIGELMLKSDGSAQVIGKNPAEPANISPSQLKRRLFFPVSTPDRTGTFRLRCSIYHNQMLVQSRLIRARVTNEPESIALALQSDVDYALTDTLQPAHFAPDFYPPHQLSLMLNSNGDGTHTFSLFGSDKKEFFKKECTINASKLMTLTENARAVLREVSWGSPEPS